MINIDTGTKQLILSEDNNVATITLNNPQYKNALSEELTPYLRKVIKRISKSKNKLLILRGQGKSFCSGGNIKKMNTKEVKTRTPKKSKVMDLYKKQIELTYMISSLQIPTIAVITGPAAGAGFSLALSCDIRIGNRHAFFLSNYSRIGLTGDYGISWYLSKLVGNSKAKEIMLINNRIYADEAHRIGILNFIFKTNLERNLEIIKKNIVSQSSLAVKLIKKNINYAEYNDLKKSLKLEAEHLIKSSMSKEHKIAVANFKKD
tara:strand:+ start:204 stop:989 length:786 start_codon:yes stop_codon:yes gene_type:complete